MSRKHLILGVLVGPLIIFYKIIYIIVSRLFHKSLHNIAISPPLVYGSLVSLTSYLLLGLKHGFVTTLMIAITLLVEHFIELPANKSEAENDIVHF